MIQGDYGGGRLRAEEDVDEIEGLCAGCMTAGFIEPTTWQRGAGGGARISPTVARKGAEKTSAGILEQPGGPRVG